MEATWQSHQRRLAALKRHRPDDVEAIAEAREALRKAREDQVLQDAVCEVVDRAPRLTPDQRDTLATLLRPAKKPKRKKISEWSPDEWAAYQRSIGNGDL